MSCEISLTPAAVQRFQQQLAHTHHTAIRLSVKKAGCSGLEYVVDFSDDPRKDDLECPQNGFMMYVDKESYELALKGLEIDFQKDLLSAAFVYNNPNKTGECGCGVSFTI